MKGPLCKGCVLERIGQGFARTDGAGRLGLLGVAEALGETEARERKPLVGAAGKVFNRILSRTIDPETLRPLERDDFTLANVVNCRPPNNLLNRAPYEAEAIRQCSPYLIETIQKVKPKVIIAMGNTPLRWFTGEEGIESLRGYIFDTKWGTVVPTYHPSYIQRGNWHLTRVVQLDILKALYISRHGKPTFKKEYTPNPTVHQARAFKEAYFRAGCPLLAFDLETPYIGSEDKDEDIYIESVEEDDPSFTILMCSFSFIPGEAITFPWIEPFISIAKEILASTGPKTGWNIRGFDIRRLVANGAPVNGRIYDGMDAWHFLEPALPMGLKYAATFHCPDMSAWRLQAKKHKAWYCAGDSDVALRVMNAVRKNLERENRWTTFERHFVDLALALDQVTLRGINVNKTLRKEERERFHQKYLDVVAELQPLVPQKVKPKKLYKKSQEQLRKPTKRKGIEVPPVWEEGLMIPIMVTLSSEEEKKIQQKAERSQAKLEEKMRKSQLRAAAAEEKRRLRSLIFSRRKVKTSSLEKNSSVSAINVPGKSRKRTKKNEIENPEQGSL